MKQSKSLSFTVRDHTLVVGAVMEHPMQVFRRLPSRYKRKNARSPGKEVLRALLRVEQVDERVKERARAMLAVLPKLERARARLPRSAHKAVEALRKRLDGKTIAQQSRLLRDPRLRRKHRDDGLAVGMEVGVQMLKHGRTSIYSADHGFYELLQEGQGTPSSIARDALSDIGSADTVGATGGGGIGLFFGPEVAAPLAIVVGVEASAAAVVVHVVDWIFDIF
jgi:hypothetical protein